MKTKWTLGGRCWGVTWVSTTGGGSGGGAEVGVVAKLGGVEFIRLCVGFVVVGSSLEFRFYPLWVLWTPNKDNNRQDITV